MKNFQIIASFLFIFLAYFSLHAESEVIINEIHYDVPDKTIRAEFIELHNTTDVEPGLRAPFQSGTPL